MRLFRQKIKVYRPLVKVDGFTKPTCRSGGERINQRAPLRVVGMKQVRVLHVGQQQGQFANGKAESGIQQPIVKSSLTY